MIDYGLYYGDLIERKHPLNRGLVFDGTVLPWHMSGPRLIDHAGRSHGTLINGPKWDGANGRPGGWGSLGFDAATTYVSIPSNPALTLQATDTFTWTGWVYPRSMVGIGGLINKDDAGGNREYFIFQNSSVYTAYLFNSVGGLTNVDIGIIANRWNFVAFRFDGSNIYLSLNAGSPASAAFSGVPKTGTAALEMGRAQQLDSRILNGSLDGWVLHKRFLSASEVVAQYDESRRGNPTRYRRVRAWCFGVSSSAITATLSVTLADATVSGTATVATSGSASPSLEPATLSGQSSVDVAASLAVTLAAATVSGSATVAASGTASPSLEPVTLSGSATVDVIASLAATLASATLAGTAIVGTPAPVETFELWTTVPAALVLTATLPDDLVLTV